MMKIIYKLKYRALASLLTLAALFVVSACQDDDEVGFNDQRYLPGELAFYFSNPNPETGMAYTEEEIAERKARLGSFAYNPAEEERFVPEQPVILNWMLIKQISELKINNVTDINNVTELYSFSSAEAAGDLYKISINTTLAELGITEEGQEINTKWDFTYVDGSVGTDFFTISWAKPPPVPVAASDLPALIGPWASAVKGYWKFDDASDLTKAAIGNTLEVAGPSSGITASEGVNTGDGAVSIATGSGFSVLHGLPASGGSNVNTYTLIYDVKAPNVYTYVNLLQTDTSNSGDGSWFINPNAGMWIRGVTSEGADWVMNDTWHRIVCTLNNGVATYYVDGVQRYTGDTGLDASVSLDPSSFFVFLDDSGEDAPISCTSLILLDQALTSDQVSSLPAVDEPAYKDVKDDLAGRWKFDDTSDLTKATVGNALEVAGPASGITASEGVSTGDGAASIATGSGFSVLHGLPASGGSNVNTYTLIYDVKAPNVYTYVNLLQTDTSNSGDGSWFINPNAGMWIRGVTSEGADWVMNDTWHRIVCTLNNGVATYYVDGVQRYTGDTGLDASVSLDPSSFFVFLDDSGEDAPISCTDLILLKTALSGSDVSMLPAVDTPAF